MFHIYLKIFFIIFCADYRQRHSLNMDVPCMILEILLFNFNLFCMTFKNPSYGEVWRESDLIFIARSFSHALIQTRTHTQVSSSNKLTNSFRKKMLTLQLQIKSYFLPTFLLFILVLIEGGGKALLPQVSQPDLHIFCPCCLTMGLSDTLFFFSCKQSEKKIFTYLMSLLMALLQMCRSSAQSTTADKPEIWPNCKMSPKWTQSLFQILNLFTSTLALTCYNLNSQKKVLYPQYK